MNIINIINKKYSSNLKIINIVIIFKRIRITLLSEIKRKNLIG